MPSIKKSVVNPEVLTQNKHLIHSFLRDSYSAAKKQWMDSISFFKDEFSQIRDMTGTYLNQMILPVNNFLKDITEIDTELKEEVTSIPSNPCLIPLEVAAAISNGEENY